MDGLVCSINDLGLTVHLCPHYLLQLCRLPLLHLLLLLQVASPHIKAQWAWASACNLIKMTSVRPEAFPVS